MLHSRSSLSNSTASVVSSHQILISAARETPLSLPALTKLDLNCRIIDTQIAGARQLPDCLLPPLVPCNVEGLGGRRPITAVALLLVMNFAKAPKNIAVDFCICSPKMECSQPRHRVDNRGNRLDIWNMLNLDYLSLAGIVAILAFLWNLHRDMLALSERLSRIEGLIDGLRSAITERKS